MGLNIANGLKVRCGLEEPSRCDPALPFWQLRALRRFPAPRSIAPGRQQDINERRSARKANAKRGARTDRIEGLRVKKGKPGRPARAGCAALPAFPAALAGPCGQNERGPRRTARRLGLERGLDPKLGCRGHASWCAVQRRLKVGVRVWLHICDELAGAFRTRTGALVLSRFDGAR